MIFIFYWLPFFHSIYSWESESQTHKRKKLNAERESRRMAMVSWNLGAHQKTPALHVTCRKKERDRDHSYPYKVIEITPPPKNLGIRCFPTVCFFPFVSVIFWFFNGISYLGFS
ncbi:hypothetical protein H0E87_000874 [Populus deltoides]|uniref:Uncharacterized protein n=1 Tax=Populus deltoides TaxID=3696 RepID=A0A8T2ZPI1_POPDE|nr:hypothetical protein H0E87_000874 [Populus deltoides]